MNSRIEYLYRDSSNYKKAGSVLLSGEISERDRAVIKSKLDSGEMFVAEQIGLPSLRDKWFAEEVLPSQDDNGWHWLLSICSTTDDELTLMSASEFVNRFSAVKAWQLNLAE